MKKKLALLLAMVMLFSAAGCKKEEVVEEPTTKVCPFCQSEISINAVKCPHCTSSLEK